MFNGMTGRAFEIMACKRLCLCYLNEDTMFKHMELFKDGEDIVYWKTFEEMAEKFEYYKAHPEEAQRIALNGYNKVRAHHNQDVRAKFFADTVLKMANEKADKKFKESMGRDYDDYDEAVYLASLKCLTK
jgi:spore maturation protein CgeB